MSVHHQSRDELIQILINGVTDFTDVEQTINTIQLFETDPLMLEKALPDLIRNLLAGYLDASEDVQHTIARIFYQFSKILRNKRIREQIPINVYDLPIVLKLLKNTTQWQSKYLLISWVTMLVMSPFKFNNDAEIVETVSQCGDIASVRPLIAMIKAELWSKNSDLILIPDNLLTLNAIDLNYMIKTLKHKMEYPFSSSQLIDMTESIIAMDCFRDEIEGLYILKLLPKLVVLLANDDQTWQFIYDLLFWMTSTLNLTFTELRFKLAKSVSKIVLFLLSKDKESASMVVADCLEDTEDYLKANTNDSIDMDRLHTSLLILAELCRNHILTVTQIETVSAKIIPRISKFQQKRMMSTQGHQIRDTSNFLCWSLCRTYPDISASCLTELFKNMLFTANFDHSPLIRKSGMAALQECIGRQGISILDNVTVVRLVEIHVGRMANASLLYRLFDRKYPDINESMMHWLVDYTIGVNFDIPSLKIAVSQLSKMVDEFDDGVCLNLVNDYNKRLAFHAVKTQDSSVCSRCVYLHFKINSQCTETISELLEVLHKRTMPKVWIDEMSFHALAELLGIFSVMVKGARVTQRTIERIFSIVRYIQTNDYNYHEVSDIFNCMVHYLSKNEETFDDITSKNLFWTTFNQLFRFEQQMVCSAAPFLVQDHFISLFYDVVPRLPCEFKGKMIDSLSKVVDSYVENETFVRFLNDLVEFLADYTTTNQGDVGRITRLALLNLVQNHLIMFDKYHLKNVIETHLLRLSAEPVIEIRKRALELLLTLNEGSCDNVLEQMPLNQKALHVYHQFYSGNENFWEGYFFSIGAIQSTDKQISSAVDEFLQYYLGLDKTQQLGLINSLALLLPSATDFIKDRKVCRNKSVTGTEPRDFSKIVISNLNGWCRILESGISIHQDFNYTGFFARVYNLQLKAKSTTITSYSMKLLTLLVGKMLLEEVADSKTIANKYISILISRLKGTKESMSMMQKLALESLTHVYICMNDEDRIKLLVSKSQNVKELQHLDQEAFFFET